MKTREHQGTTPIHLLLVSSCFEQDSYITASKERTDGVKTPEDSHYPLGLAYLHSMAESRGHQVRSLFLNNESEEHTFQEVLKSLKEFRPNVVALQMLTANRVSTYRLIEHIHAEYPETTLLVGGIHATIMHRQLLEKYPFIIIVRGEGEMTLAEILDRRAAGNLDLSSIEGIAFSKNNKQVVTPERQLLDDLDMLPYPKHELFLANGRQTACILTARGCPFSCSFCSLDSISRKRVRFRSIAKVVDEIEHIMAIAPETRRIWIHDDTFFIDNDRVIAFCDEVVRRGIHLEFICSGRMKPLSRIMVEKLEQANFTKVLLGLESADEGILKAAKKNISREDVLNAFHIFSKSSIELYAFLIVGLPGETEQTILQTAQFVQGLQRIKYLHYVDDIAVLAVYPGTDIFTIAKRHGLLDESHWLTDDPTPLFTVEHSFETLLQFKEQLLDRIAMQRLLTLKGFLQQYHMLPYVLRHLVASGKARRSCAMLLARLLHRVLPAKAYTAARAAYRSRLQKNRKTPE